MDESLNSGEKSPTAWVTEHRDRGHDATLTQIAAPGYGTGSWCWTCKEYGPARGGILAPGDVI